MLIARSSPRGSRPSLSARLSLLDRTDVIDLGFDYMLPASSPPSASSSSRRASLNERGATPAPLRRDPANGYIAGVCAGFAARLGIDPLLIRIGFVIAARASVASRSRSTPSAG